MRNRRCRTGDFLHGRFVLIRRGKKALGVVEQA